MDTPDISRRELLIQGSAGLALLHAPWFVHAFPSRPGEEVVPWLDQPGANPSGGVVENLQPWENLASSFITPNDKFFRVSHYDKPVIDEKKWNLEIAGLVKKPMTLTLPAIKARPKQEVVYTIECGGNHGFPWFTSRHRQCEVGRHTTRGAAEASRCDGSRKRGRLLGSRFGHGDHPRDENSAALCAQHVARRCDEPEQPAVLRNEWRGTSAAAWRSGAVDSAGLVWRCERQVAEPN